MLFFLWLSFSGVVVDLCFFVLLNVLSCVSDPSSSEEMETMLPQKQAEEAIVASLNETESEVGGVREEEKELQDQSGFSFKNLLWHGGSVWDAWFSCASNQVILNSPHH